MIKISENKKKTIRTVHFDEDWKRNGKAYAIKLADSDIKALDELIKNNFFFNRADAIRQAIYLKLIDRHTYFNLTKEDFREHHTPTSIRIPKAIANIIDTFDNVSKFVRFALRDYITLIEQEITNFEGYTK